MLPADLISDGALPAWGEAGTAYTYRDTNLGSSDDVMLVARARPIDVLESVSLPYDTALGHVQII